MAANKIPGIRCGLAHEPYSAHQAVEHDDANAIAMGAWLVPHALVADIVARVPRRDLRRRRGHPPPGREAQRARHCSPPDLLPTPHHLHRYGSIKGDHHDHDHRAPPPRRSSLGSKDRVKTAIAAGVGTSVENYDFIAYGTAAALYFGAVFFPETTARRHPARVRHARRRLRDAPARRRDRRLPRRPVRPQARARRRDDRDGRRDLLIGLLPTYAQIGVAAPILLALIRMVQGLAFGAEWGGAITMAYEHAPWHRRGMFAAIPQAGNPLGIALASAHVRSSAPTSRATGGGACRSCSARCS